MLITLAFYLLLGHTAANFGVDPVEIGRVALLGHSLTAYLFSTRYFYSDWAGWYRFRRASKVSFQVGLLGQHTS